jgi:hypothetical protein
LAEPILGQMLQDLVISPITAATLKMTKFKVSKITELVHTSFKITVWTGFKTQLKKEDKRNLKRV